MLIDRTHLGWGLASAAAFGAATVAYAVSVAGPREGSGGSAAGLVFGMLALAAMIFAGLLAVRKKLPGVRLGSAQFWLRGHIWLGLLSVPLVFYHASFEFGGPLEMTLMLVFLAVIASGVYGLALQQVLPRLLKVRVPLETFPQQIPYLLEKMKEEAAQLIKELEGPAKKAPVAAGIAVAAPAAAAAKGAASATTGGDAAAKIAAAKAAAEKPTPAALAVAAKLAAARAAAKQAAPSSAAAEAGAASAAVKPPTSAPAAGSDWSLKRPVQMAAPAAPADAGGPMPRVELLARFVQEKVAPFLSSDPRVAARQDLASENYARMAFANLTVALPARALAAIGRLEEIVAERRQFLVQVRIQSWLRNWLLVHVPLSAALFVLAAVHVIVALRVVPFF